MVTRLVRGFANDKQLLSVIRFLDFCGVVKRENDEVSGEACLFTWYEQHFLYKFMLHMMGIHPGINTCQICSDSMRIPGF